MASELEAAPAYRHTMERLKAVKKLTPEGVAYWMGREIVPILGYASLHNLMPVIERAKDSLAANGHDPSHHIVQTHGMMGVGNGAKREVSDFFLSRAACYLIALNGLPSKPEIAAAQAYFVDQTWQLEQIQTATADHKRLHLRDKVSDAFKRVSKAADGAGVKNYGLFHNARIQGLYEMNIRDLERAKGLSIGEPLFDRAGDLELATNAFQMELAAEKIVNDGINGERRAIDTNLSVAKDVRATVSKQGVKLEALPLEPEPIQAVRKRVRAQRRLSNGG